jgi:hypothetical protein
VAIRVDGLGVISDPSTKFKTLNQWVDSDAGALIITSSGDERPTKNSSRQGDDYSEGSNDRCQPIVRRVGSCRRPQTSGTVRSDLVLEKLGAAVRNRTTERERILLIYLIYCDDASRDLHTRLTVAREFVNLMTYLMWRPKIPRCRRIGRM